MLTTVGMVTEKKTTVAQLKKKFTTFLLASKTGNTKAVGRQNKGLMDKTKNCDNLSCRSLILTMNI